MPNGAASEDAGSTKIGSTKYGFKLNLPGSYAPILGKNKG
jgi:hypothetical protein